MDKETLPFALPEHIKSGPAAYIQMSDLARSVIVQNADSLENGLLRPRHSKITRLGAGVFEGTLQAVKIPSALMMFGGKGLVAMGGAFGEESRLSEWGREMIRAGAREIDAKNKTIAKKSGDVFGLEDDEKETMSYAVGAGFGNMATILLAAYATGGKGGAVFAGAQEIAGETEKRMYAARAKGEDPAEISQGQAAKEFAATAAYGATAGMLEKVNLGKIMPFLRTSKKWYVAALQSAVSEGTTEFAQSLTAMGFGLADGTIDFSRVPAEIYGALQEGVVGGTVGGAFSLKNRRDVKGMFRDRLRDTVPAQDLERVVDALYNASADTMAGIVVKELALSEELRNKHGEIYSAMLDAANKTLDASGAFADVSADERQDYVQQTAAMFADQVLAEANKRQVAIDDVLTGAQIVFENGGIAFKNRDFTLTEDGVFEQAMYRSKIDNVGDFYDSVVKKEDSRPRYFSYTTKSGAELSLPDYIINHDIKRHNLTRDDFETVFQNLENIEAYSVSNRLTDVSTKSVLLKLSTPEGIYGVSIAVGENQNYISTMFKSTGKNGVDAWMRKEASAVPSSQLTATNGENANSVTTRGKPLKDIISEVRKEINPTFYQNKYDGYRLENRFAELPDGFIRAVGDMTKYGGLPTRKQRAELRGKFNVSDGDIQAVSEYLSELRRRRFIRKDVPRQMSAKEKLDRKRNNERLKIKEEKDRSSAMSSLSEDVFNALSESEKEAYVRDYSEAGLKGRRDIIAHENLMFFKKHVLPDILKDGNVKKVKESDLSESVYLDGLRVSDHSLPGKYNGDDGVILSGKKSAKEIRDTVLAAIDDAKRKIFNQTAAGRSFPHGMYSQAENLIRLTKDADFSTLPHELAHFWLTEQETCANTKSASDEYVDAFNQALNWLGVKDGKTINRRAQEQFARGYEQYLLDGNLPRTPDSDILPTYRRYDRWLKRVYDAMNQPSKKPLTEEIVRFFQSMTTGSLPPTVLPVAANVPEREKDARENAENIGKDATPQIDFKSAVFNLSDERRAHIEKHLGQIKRAGFDGVDDYIGYISENYDAVYADPALPERYWFTVTESGNHNNLMVVEAIKNEKTGGFDIITAFPRRKSAFKNKKNLLSGGAQSNHSQGIPQNEALTGQKQIYGNNISSNDAFVNRPSASSPTVVRSDELSGAYWKPAAAQENANGKVSRAQERQNRLNRLNGLLSEDAVSTTYEAAHLADAGQKAVNLIETRGIDAARKMIDGKVPTEDGVLRTALMIEYEQKMLAEGNVEEYTRVLRLHTLEQTRRGIGAF